MRHLSLLLVAAVMLVASAAQAQQSRFTTGPVISDYGPVAEIESAAPVPPETVFKVKLREDELKSTQSAPSKQGETTS